MNQPGQIRNRNVPVLEEQIIMISFSQRFIGNLVINMNQPGQIRNENSPALDCHTTVQPRLTDQHLTKTDRKSVLPPVSMTSICFHGSGGVEQTATVVIESSPHMNNLGYL
ncbi:hypothetical protein M0R45_007452 [Rubus argutus]|uniref:Uncharacterized protein n=1 Tax=Rubus argutus TaxID=59490 RepID=A0AAW1Y161_RUBAR